jgi:hypothetical protein
MKNFEIMRMQTLKAERNAVSDDTESQRAAMARAKAWQDEESAKIFEGRSGPAPSESTLSSSRSWPESSMRMGTTTPQDVYARARSEAEQAANDEPPTMAELGLIEDVGGMQDSVMSFYAGKPFTEGRKAHNQYLVSRGKAPIPEGRK